MSRKPSSILTNVRGGQTECDFDMDLIVFPHLTPSSGTRAYTHTYLCMRVLHARAALFVCVGSQMLGSHVLQGKGATAFPWRGQRGCSHSLSGLHALRLSWLGDQ